MIGSVEEDAVENEKEIEENDSELSLICLKYLNIGLKSQNKLYLHFRCQSYTTSTIKPP